MRAALLVSLSIAVLPALRAEAQDKGQLGVDLSVGSGSSATIGVTYHVSKRLALRPTFAFSHSTLTNDGVFSAPDGSLNVKSDQTTNSFSAGLEALLYLTRRDAFSTYLGGSYQRVHSSVTSDPPQLALPLAQLPPALARFVRDELGLIPQSKRTTDNDVAALALGVQYAFAKSFSAFGEAGLRYVSGRSRLERTQSRSLFSVSFSPGDNSQLATFTSSVGVIFYLK